MTPIKCCKNCTEREVGCHGWCEIYIQEKANYEHRKAETSGRRDAEMYSREVSRDKTSIMIKHRQNKRHWNLRGRR